jgi:transcriptional regulator with XRE-family HTH domain
MRSNLARAVRALRLRRGWRQDDLAQVAGTSRSIVSRIELGKLDGLTLGSASQVVEALGGTLVVDARWHGADLDRLIDSTHAGIQDAAAGRLRRAAWDVHAEVAFNHYGDRGSCDLVAWHAATRTLLVVEVKSRIGNLQDLLRRLDLKVRLGRQLAAQLGLGAPSSVIRALVLAESHGSRSIVAAHPDLFAGFDLRGRTALRWLARPRGGRGLWFENTRWAAVSPNARDLRTIPVERVRHRLGAASGEH